jgi:hypothetical protein
LHSKINNTAVTLQKRKENTNEVKHQQCEQARGQGGKGGPASPLNVSAFAGFGSVKLTVASRILYVL